MSLPFSLQANERIVLLTRRHWLYFLPHLLLDLILLVAPPALLWYLLGLAGWAAGIGWKIALAISIAWGLWLAFRIWLLWYRYVNDLWVITDRRVIDLVRTSPFNYHMSEADLDEIEDQTTRISGVLGTLFNFGDLECQTAAEQRHFAFRGVARPRDVAAVLQHESARFKDAARRGFASSPSDDRPAQA